MGPRFNGNGLGFGLCFLAPFVALLWAVRVVFRALGLQELEIPGRPIQIRSRAASRLIGALFALGGIGFMVWSWRDAHDQGRFFLKMAAGGPAFLGMEARLVIEGPEFPVRRASRFGWALAMPGLGAGFLYAEFLRTGRLPFGR